jgi:hypothetical protein
MTTLTRARPVIAGKAKPGTSLLILSPNAGSMTPEIEAKLRKAFDGTIGWVVRPLADTKHPLGILSLGTPATITAELSALQVILPS